MKKSLILLSIITVLLLTLTSCVSDISSDKLSGNNSVTKEDANLPQESSSDTNDLNTETTENQAQESESAFQEETTNKQDETIQPDNTTAPPETTTAPPTESLITKQRAKKIALTHAGVKEADIIGFEIELDREINGVKYELSFHAGNFEYEYEINAVNGNIIKSEKEAERTTRPQTTPDPTTAPVETTTAPSSEELISKQKAKEIALTHANLKEADIRNYEIELDREANKTVYEISFDSGYFEYEYEINAKNGQILQSEKERAD